MTVLQRSGLRPFRAGWLVAALATAAAWASPVPPAALSPSVLATLDAAQADSNRFPPPDQVFQLQARATAGDIVLDWRIRPGFYLYRSRIHIRPLGTTRLGRVVLPSGQIKVDPYFGREQIYRNAVSAELPITRAPASGRIALAVTYQGCADAGLCYPPITRTVSIKMPPGGGATGPAAVSSPPAGTAASTPANGPAVAGQTQYAGLVRSAGLLTMLGWFYLAGLALAFTPCCLPMIPIVSGIIAGGGRMGPARGFRLSLTYVLGMALTYTLAGAAAAAAGGEIQAAFQRPWILGSFAALLAVMGLAMFGLFTVQMPSRLQTWFTELGNRQRAGTLAGVAVMGALSALIVTTCVGPALVGALAVIGQSGEVLRGASALFALSIGMGTPLLAVGASAGRLLPKAGPWMDTVKKLFGAMMLGVAVWMLERLISARIALALWAIPALAGAWALLAGAPRLRGGRIALRAAGLLTGAYGLVLLTGAALGATSPLWPVTGLTGAPELRFTPVSSVAQLQRDVARAESQHRTVMVDFYADWCTSCKELEATTFTSPAVRTALANTVLLRADVTANNANDRQLLKYFGIFGPPTVAFYDNHGREQRSDRVVGYLGATDFLRRVRAAFGSSPAS